MYVNVHAYMLSKEGIILMQFHYRGITNQEYEYIDWFDSSTNYCECDHYSHHKSMEKETFWSRWTAPPSEPSTWANTAKGRNATRTKPAIRGYS